MSRKRGGFALIVLGMVVAFGVAIFVFNQAQRAAETARMESVDVLVAAQDIPERTVMVAPFLSSKRMLPTSLPPAAVTRPEEIIGKMTVGRILAGDFMPAKLVDSDGHSGVAFVVPKGRVVITLPASDILTTGAVHPGDTIDLLVTIKPDQEKNRAGVATPTVSGAPTGPAAPVATSTPVGGPDVEVGTTQTTMQNLKVLAIGSVQNTQAAPPKEPVEGKTKEAIDKPAPTVGLITFAVERQDALVLKALKDSERVKLEMVLRGAGDDKLATTDPVTLNTIVDRYQFRAVATPAAKR